jgi:hypothetical protein
MTILLILLSVGMSMIAEARTLVINIVSGTYELVGLISRAALGLSLFVL